MVRTGTRTSEEMDEAEILAAEAAAIAVKIAETTWLQNNYLKGKIKNGPIFKLIITKIGHRPTHYKKIVDTLPVLCADKNFQGFNYVIWTENDLFEADFVLLYLDALQWSTAHHVQVSTVNPYDVPQADGSHTACFETMEQTHIFDTNLQKELLSE